MSASGNEELAFVNKTDTLLTQARIPENPLLLDRHK